MAIFFPVLRSCTSVVLLLMVLSGCGGGSASPSTPPPVVNLPTNPIPAGLWSPAAGVTPSVGNYVYLQSDSGDIIGTGQSAVYTRANANVTVSVTGNRLNINVDGDQEWNGTFQAMNNLSQLQTGEYTGVTHYPQYDTSRGGIDWSGENHTCSTATGWFTIDQISFNNGALASVDLRFEQHCEGAAAALHGAIHWTVVDAAPVPAVPGPVLPLPAGLWQAGPGTVPASGNYVYIQGSAGDYIVGQNSYVYTPADTLITLSASGAHVGVTINGDQQWNGDFQGMNSIGRLRRGYYGNLTRYPFSVPETGGLNWDGEGRGCNMLTGWFVVDNATYANNVMQTLDLRFEQHCEGASPAMHGQIHWNVADATKPPGPVNPPPTTLWQAPAGATPSSGNYIYVQQDGGSSKLYTTADFPLNVTANGGGLLFVTVNDPSNYFLSGDFQVMAGASLAPGYYSGLERYPFNNPVKGGLSWGGGCNTLTGWFVIDSIAFSGSDVSALDLRFEQYCDGSLYATHGQVHWVK